MVTELSECETPASTRPHISIIILNWNTSAFTIQCVRSIWEKTAYDPYDIIIVDNGSRPEELELLKAVETRNVTVHSMPANLGFSGGCNLGAARARGEYIVFLNNDTEIENAGWLDAMIRLFRSDPRIGGISCNVREEQGYAFPGTASDLPHLYGAAMMISRKAWDLVGDLDAKNFSPAYGEELDWSYRAGRIGFKLRFCLEARVFHYGSRTAAKNLSMQQSFRLRLLHRVRFRFFNYGVRDWFNREIIEEFRNAFREDYVGLLIGAYTDAMIHAGTVIKERRRRRVAARAAMELMKNGGTPQLQRA